MRTSRRTRHRSRNGALQFLRELPVLVVVALGIALLIKTFILQAFFIPSESMTNTLLKGDRVLVSKFVYRFGDPKPGHVVVFVSPYGDQNPEIDRGPVGNFFNGLAETLGLRSSEKDFIKRVIATGGQTVEAKQGAVYVDGQRLSEPYRYDQTPVPDFAKLTVPENEVFVMGDNRNNSADSRAFGPIPESTIIGRAFVLIWPPNRITLLRSP